MKNRNFLFYLKLKVMCNYNSFLKDSIFRNKNKYKLKGHNKHFKKIFFKYNSSLNTIFFKCNGKEK